MSTVYSSVTLALPYGTVPAAASSMQDLTPLFEIGNGLASGSRSNWLCGALWATVRHFQADRLHFLNKSFASLNRNEIKEACEELSSVLARMRNQPETLGGLVALDDDYKAQVVRALSEQVSDWGSVPMVNDGDDYPYLVSFLVRLLALLSHALSADLQITYAQDHAHFEPQTPHPTGEA